ncbi:hypothetical protein IAQ61_000195 [Plenodomus lingam]|uniref:Predicted protein n=1 Tax=Leptosphaeria maculans (strain JN3 / isolate v23.1.3 / race Av1-4-5-6-7-8) TaxID=985895 RepID=E5R523_LEPMJ|nr:predicted protein [Plenodomus lingam JN3]KAH9881470.1 hypothetical protein IAQ61_000195 [Plenodomus lingam]CBX91993.1 predicted protein [Plenodomus lingam JN3]
MGYLNEEQEAIYQDIVARINAFDVLASQSPPAPPAVPTRPPPPVPTRPLPPTPTRPLPPIPVRARAEKESSAAYTVLVPGKPLPRRPSTPNDHTGIGDLPAALLRRIIFGHLNDISSRSALTRAAPSIVIKAVRREPMVPIAQVDPGWPLKRLQLELVLLVMDSDEIIEDTTWWYMWSMLRRAGRR